MAPSVGARDNRKRSTYDAPFEDPWDSLTPGAKRIVAAAADLLATEGYDALTHERIAEVAGVNKSTIRYHFKSKSAVVAAVVDAMIHDGCLQLVDMLEGADSHRRVDGAVTAMRDMIVETNAFRGYFDILPHALREPELRDRIRALYEWWYVENQKWLGLTEDGDPERARLRLGVGQIIAGLIDGLSIQAALDPDGYDMGPALDALVIMLRASVASIATQRPNEDRVT